MKQQFQKLWGNGSKRAEGETIDGRCHGKCRTWYQNGVLESEVNYDRGIFNGPFNYWDMDGNLVTSGTMKMGTGRHRFWSQMTDVIAEQDYVNNVWHGRCRIVTRDEKYLISDEYYRHGKRISKKAYMDASATDPTLPVYDINEPKLPRLRIQKPSTKPEEFPENNDKFLESLLESPDAREAIGWLQENTAFIRTLGESDDPHEAMDLVKKIYAIGAVRVTVLDPDGAKDQPQNAGKLILELPEDLKQRANLLTFAGRIARKQGYSKIKDCGQRLLFLGLD